MLVRGAALASTCIDAASGGSQQRVALQFATASRLHDSQQREASVQHREDGQGAAGAARRRHARGPHVRVARALRGVQALGAGPGAHRRRAAARLTDLPRRGQARLRPEAGVRGPRREDVGRRQGGPARRGRQARRDRGVPRGLLAGPPRLHGRAARVLRGHRRRRRHQNVARDLPHEDPQPLEPAQGEHEARAQDRRGQPHGRGLRPRRLLRRPGEDGRRRPRAPRGGDRRPPGQGRAPRRVQEGRRHGLISLGDPGARHDGADAPLAASGAPRRTHPRPGIRSHQLS
mmetsp:Transcript_31552/g.104331  ORF Transcript_31552/g.104331 Transcript_31552/m.104331 type:complete len:289 (-) Transcript_31552:955-1821(-)